MKEPQDLHPEAQEPAKTLCTVLAIIVMELLEGKEAGQEFDDIVLSHRRMMKISMLLTHTLKDLLQAENDEEIFDLATHMAAQIAAMEQLAEMLGDKLRQRPEDKNPPDLPDLPPDARPDMPDLPFGM